jgi:hypothetical protein
MRMDLQISLFRPIAGGDDGEPGAWPWTGAGLAALQYRTPPNQSAADRKIRAGFAALSSC